VCALADTALTRCDAPPVLTIAVLDEVELRRDGVLIPVRPGKTTEVLIRLALEAGERVRTEQLIDDLWGGQAVATARNTLQTKISRLRRALGDPALVSGTAEGYTLHVDPAAVDALQVSRLATTAGEQRTAGDVGAAHLTCLAALAMFGTAVLPSAGRGDWSVPYRVRLEELRLALLESDLADRLALGGGGEVVAELEALVRLHPLAESAWKLLMLALYRAGRQADALAAYRRISAVLADELGIEPGAPLQAMERQVLLHDPHLDPDAVPSSAARPPASGNVPALSSQTVGRDADALEVQRLVAQNRLVTVVGTAGVGKTRLAMDVARQDGRPDGAWLVRLEGTCDERSVLQAMAAALDVPPGTEAALVQHLRGTDVLLVLDTCEHVVDAVAACVSRLLRDAVGVGVLCTSQLPLGVDGEVVHQLEPLSVEDSVSLFSRLASAQRRSFALDGDAATALRGVCRTLDGLPLAIELAASRAKTLPIEEIARRLDHRFALLTDPTSRQPARRRALGAAIGWSYDLLFPDDQRGLWALACFSDGATLTALDRVLAALDVPADSALDVVARLAARSLLAVDPHPDAVRYRLLDSIRAYALDRLQEAGHAQAARAAHARWIAEAADRAGRELRGPRQAAHLTFVQTERLDIDAALAWTVEHDPALALRIACGFAWAWFLLGDRPRGALRLRAALAATDGDAAPEDRVDALCLSAWLENHDVTAARSDAEQALALAGDDQHLSATSRTALAFVLLQQAQPQEALTLLDGTAAVQLQHGRAWESAAAWILTVHAALLVGDTATAAAGCRAADALVVALGDDWATGHLHGALGFLAQAEHRYGDATDHLQQAAHAAERLGFRATQALHLATLGRILQRAGELDAALAALQQSVMIGLDIKDLRVVALGRVRLARVLRAQGEEAAAAEAAHAADHWFRTSGGGEGARLAACLAAAIDAAAGDGDAPERLRGVLQDARQHGDHEIEVLTLDALARWAAAAGDPLAAQRHLSAADALRPTVQHLLDEADRVDAVPARVDTSTPGGYPGRRRESS
jgi:predicted ATPase/DNA-binding SARP family transcriptional activator